MWVPPNPGPPTYPTRRITLTPGEASTILPGWEVIHTPGHTPGHVSFFRQSDGTLLVGDAFCTTKPESFFEAAIAQQPVLHGSPAYLTSDWAAARRSVEALSRLAVSCVAPGHGRPLCGPDVRSEIGQLAAKFLGAAVPENRQGTV